MGGRAGLGDAMDSASMGCRSDRSHRRGGGCGLDKPMRSAGATIDQFILLKDTEATRGGVITLSQCPNNYRLQSPQLQQQGRCWISTWECNARVYEGQAW